MSPPSVWQLKAVLLTGTAAKRRGIDASWLAVVGVFRIDVLSRDVGPANPDDRDLVSADSARDDFLFPGRRIEAPRVSVLDERNGKGPGLVANHERLAARSLIDPSRAFLERDGEHVAIVSCGDGIRRIDQLPPISPEDRDETINTRSLGGVVQRLRGFFWSLERPLA